MILVYFLLELTLFFGFEFLSSSHIDGLRFLLESFANAGEFSVVMSDVYELKIFCVLASDFVVTNKFF